jgi:hypothetical protein
MSTQELMLAAAAVLGWTSAAHGVCIFTALATHILVPSYDFPAGLDFIAVSLSMALAIGLLLYCYSEVDLLAGVNAVQGWGTQADGAFCSTGVHPSIRTCKPAAAADRSTANEQTLHGSCTRSQMNCPIGWTGGIMSSSLSSPSVSLVAKLHSQRVLGCRCTACVHEDVQSVQSCEGIAHKQHPTFGSTFCAVGFLLSMAILYWN